VARPHFCAWTGETVTLDGSRSWSRSGRIVRYEWTFGDGSKASGHSVTRIYADSEQNRIDVAQSTAGSIATVLLMGFIEMREKFAAIYGCTGIPYSNSFANEVVTKAVCIFRMTHGNTWEGIKSAVNMGRDTDCLAAVTGGISGALTGAASIPEALIRQVDHATSVNPYTCCKLTLRETADGLYDAFKARIVRTESFIAEMDIG